MIGRYVLATAAVVLLVVGLLLGAVVYLGLHYGEATDSRVRIGTLAEALTPTADGLQLDPARTPADWLQGYAWAMALDDDGSVIWQHDLPQNLNKHYTASEIASFSRWYLDDWPVFCWTADYGLFVAAVPRGSVWKYNIYNNEQLMNAMAAGMLPALALLLGCLPALAEIKPLSLEEVAQAPAEQYYTSDTHYEDPSLTVDIGEGRIHETNYVYAVIKIADPSQIRTAMAYKYNSSRTVPGETMATANNAVLAINADYHNYYDYGYLVRQGVEYRMRPRKEWDVLMIDQHGDLHVIIEPTKKKVEDWHAANPDLTVVNSFNFGPVIKIDGEWRRMHQDTVQNFFQIAGAKQYARMAVCQLDTLTYLIVSCESVLDENSSGMTLKEFEECLQEVEGKLDGYEIKLAYNIDGGGSTTMVFHNKKINSLTNPKVRDLSDILYFVSIYSE